ncbi:hypothetical protein GGI13_007606, partial [Coemansia sp. RSA 455]
MFAGIKLFWLVVAKVLAAITIQFDDFNPFNKPDDPNPPVTSQFLRQLCLNDNNSSVPFTGRISHIPDDEADDASSNDNGDNSNADFPRLRVDNKADVKVFEKCTLVDETSASVNLPEEHPMQGADIPKLAPIGIPIPASTDTRTGYNVGSPTGVPLKQEEVCR